MTSHSPDAASVHVFGKGPATGATSHWWSCSCGSLGGGWPNHDIARREADAHLAKHSATADDSSEFYEGTLMDGLADEPSAARSQAHLVDTYREALNAIVAAATESIDSMRSERDQLRERGNAMLAIAREALHVPK